EGIVQTTNLRPGVTAPGRQGGESRSGKKIRRAARPVPVRVRPPAPCLTRLMCRAPAWRCRCGPPARGWTAAKMESMAGVEQGPRTDTGAEQAFVLGLRFA